MTTNLQELKFKILIIGDSGVGKTNMLLRYVDNIFSESHIATIGVEYKTKTITRGKYKVTLNIWDTAGQERFKSITKSFFSGATGVIFVYDITKTDSFFGPTGVKNWIKDSEEYGKFEYILCGNKIDLENKRKVKFDEAKEYSIKKKIDYIETSAKTGINISQAFEKIVDLIIKNRSEDELVREFGVKSKPRGHTLTKQKANANNSGQKQGCCNK